MSDEQRTATSSAGDSAVPPPAAPETPKEPPTQAQEVPPPAAPETSKEPPTQAQEVPPPAAPETPKEPPTQAQEVPPPAAPETPKEPPTQAQEVPPPAAPETLKEPPTQAQEVPPPAAPETSKEPPTQAQEVPPPAAPETPKEPPTQAQEVPPTRLQPRSVPINSFKDVRPVLRETLDQLHHPIIDTVERQTGMDHEQLFYTVVALLTFYLLFGSYNIFVSNVLVKSYPVYQSVMTIRSQSKADDTQWLAYWCAFALFSLVDHFIAPFGPYLLLKTAVLVYMLLPQTYGAHNCFVNYVQPMMERFAERRARRHAH
ncbi:hypothetical protein niasHT_019070 [Heterodera trifolii]|uniref:Receptor expression-enhancing protein n=1 Tax=Heterodera trifolii TaxID=157864 RepID=A0ABD2LCB7_9BILA